MAQEKQQKSDTSSDRKDRILNSLFLRRVETETKLNLFRGLLETFTRYVKVFQSESPLIHTLHSRMVDLTREFLGMFLKPENIPERPSQLVKLDIEDRNIILSPHIVSAARYSKEAYKYAMWVLKEGAGVSEGILKGHLSNYLIMAGTVANNNPIDFNTDDAELAPSRLFENYGALKSNEQSTNGLYLSMLNLKGNTMSNRKTAVITGSSSGIGHAIAKGLAAAEYNIVLNGIEPADQIEPARKALADKHGVKAIYSNANLMKPEGAHELIGAAEDAFGQVDVLVNNAGIQFVAPVEEFPDEKWEAIISLNLSSSFHTTKAVIAGMKKRKWGRIINFASLQSERAFENGISYGTAKGGVMQMTRAMAQAWSKDGITVNAIAPGFFPTELTASVFANEALANQNANQTCIGRNGTMDDLTGPVQFLCSNASAYITGQTLYVDGGFTAK